MSKRLLSMILAICLVFTAFSPAAMAVEAGEDAVVNASQTAEESTETGVNSKENSHFVKGEKHEIKTLRDGEYSQEQTAGTGNGIDLQPVEGSWTYEETDLAPQISLLNTEKKAALAELKLAAQTYGQDEEVVAFVVMEEQPLVIGCDSIQKVSTAAKKALLNKQDAAISAIEKQILGGEKLQVRYQFTYLTNSFTVKTAFGNLEKILQVPGVKSVFLAPTYEPCDADKLTASSGQMVGVPSVWGDLGYTGKGMKIAIIDTGLDLDHPSFAADPETTGDSLDLADIEKVFGELNAAAACDKASPELLYRSKKVPFAFNYADGNLTANHDFDGQGDHGTHVAGIAAANAVEGTGVVGMAPDAQIIVMKVFGAGGGGAASDSLVAALEDAMLLGCDVANMSLGSANGFSSITDEIDLIYERLASQDIILTASAGNETTSSYGNMWGTDLNLASNPENSTVSQPSTYANAFSIASAENAVIKSAYFTVGGENVFYQDNYEYLLGETPVCFRDMADMPMEYVIVPGLGGQDSYYDMETGEQITDVAGKVAVILRGELSFAEKCYNAEMMGAAAVIIWNNNDEDDIFTFGMTTSDETVGYMPYIPVALVTYSDGLAMSEAEEKVLTVSATPGDRAAIGAGEMSSFSSWGPSTDLRLLPDITGIGGNVFSCYDGGQYGVMSGTSMSAPQVAGISALVMQYLKVKLPNASDGEIRDLAEALLMSTADVITDSSNGLPYTPRQQGAGLIDADGALLTDSYLTVGGLKPKAELGDSDNGAWKFSFEIHNFGDETLTYDLSGIVTAPAAASAGGLFFMLETSVALDSQLSFSKDSVTLAPGEKTNVTVTLNLIDSDKQYIDTCFENGAYVDGFVYLTCEGGQDLSLPFLGFYGDWTDAPVFDTAFWYDNSFFGVPTADGLPEGSQYYHTMWTNAGGMDWVLGMNPYSGPMLDDNGSIIYDESNNVLSPNGDGMIDGIVEMYLSLLRNAKEITITYSAGDEVLHQDSFINNPKTMYQSSYGQIVPWIHSWYDNVWDFAGVADGTTVTVDIEAYIDYGNGGKNKLSFPVTIDNTAPQIQGVAEGALEDGTNYLVVQFEDAHPAAVHVLNPSGSQLLTGTYDVYMAEVAEGVFQAMVPIGQWGTELMINICDYAGNESNYLVSYTSAGENKPEMDTSALYGYQIQDMEIYGDEMFGWSVIDKETGVDTQLCSDAYEYYALTAAEYVDGYIFAIDAGYNLIALEPGLWNRMELCYVGERVMDMSWDNVSNTMYILTKDSSGYMYLKTLDLMTGATNEVANLGAYYRGPVAMTFDDAGTLYMIKYNTANLFTYNFETKALDVVTDADGAEIKLTLSDGTQCRTSQYTQSMTHSAQDNAIYWAYTYGTADYGHSAIVTIDMETMETSGTKDAYMHEFVGLLMLEEDEDYSLPFGGALQGITLSSDSLVLSPGGQDQLTVNPIPWDHDVSEAVWASSDENVITVEDGVITAVGTGSATVTATLGEFSAECAVTVLSIGGQVYGYNFYSDDGSYGNFFMMDMETGSFNILGPSPFDFYAGDYNARDGYFYGYTESGQFHRVNMDTLEGEALGSPVATVPYDMAYDYSTGLMYAMVFDPQFGVTTIQAVDLLTGAMVDPTGSIYNNYIGDYGMAMAIGPDGTIYVIGSAGDLYAGGFVYDEWSETDVLQMMPMAYGLLGDVQLQMLQSMCYNYQYDALVWSNPETAQVFWVYLDGENSGVVAMGNPVGGQFEFTGTFTLPTEIPELPFTAVQSISAADVVMGLGQTASPSVSVLPLNATNKAYTLTSNDTNVVTVTADGQLKAVGMGTASVTVTLTDGENTFTAEFQVAVLDLAEHVYGYMMADLATYGGYSWIRIHTGDPSDPDYLDASAYDILGAEKVNDTIYAYGFDASDWSGNWKFFVMDGQHHTVQEIIDMGEGFPYIYDMAYDYANGTMYVLAGYTETNIDLYVADLETGALKRMIGLDGAWLAVAAGEGRVWLLQESVTETLYDEWGYEMGTVTHPAKLYEASTSTLEVTEVMDTGVLQNAFGSMTYDSETGYIYWAPMAQGDTGYLSGLYAVDPDKQEVYRLGTISTAGAQMSGLYVIPEEYPEISLTDITAVLLSSTKEVVTIGDTVELSTQVLPTPQVAEITWSSSNEKVATVDENGVVTTHSYGAAIITATATKDGVTVTAQCQVTALNDTDTFLTYNNTDKGWAALNRTDLSLVNLTEGEEVGVKTFAERKSRIYGIDDNDNLFYVARETYERTILGAVNAEELILDFLTETQGEDYAAAADLAEFMLDIRDMEYDKANDRMLVLAGVKTLGVYGDFEEIDGGNAIYSVDLTCGKLTKLVTLDKYNNKAMTVDNEGNVYTLCCYDDQVNLVDMETGSFESVVNLYSQSIYASTDVPQTMYYDDLADMLYIAMSQNGKFYFMLAADPDSGEFTRQSDIGELWREGWYNYGHAVSGLAYLEEEYDVQWVGKSLSTSGSIGVNFYVTLSDEVLADENTRMVFNVGGTTQVMYLADALKSTVDGVERYRFSCYVPAKGMADTIAARIYGSEGALGLSTSYSVAGYYDSITAQFDPAEKASLFALTESLLNYGAASQLYFDYNTENLANAKVPAQEITVDASAYANVVSGKADNVEYVGASLVLDSDTTLRVFFRIHDEVENHTFTINGYEMDIVERGNLYYMEITNISARNLDTAYTFGVDELSVEYSAMSYVYNVLNKADSMNAELVEVCKHLYTYAMAANEYYGN